ncbi:hypothetical protein BJ165DRAFT_1509168 [Panaeolus papilionaceus]|nr:hypothetical protein BJ165DRAFT_1509168 [Panaeolus papilionaceus]
MSVLNHKTDGYSSNKFCVISLRFLIIHLENVPSNAHGPSVLVDRKACTGVYYFRFYVRCAQVRLAIPIAVMLCVSVVNLTGFRCINPTGLRVVAYMVRTYIVVKATKIVSITFRPYVVEVGWKEIPARQCTGTVFTRKRAPQFFVRIEFGIGKVKGEGCILHCGNNMGWKNLLGCFFQNCDYLS